MRASIVDVDQVPQLDYYRAIPGDVLTAPASPPPTTRTGSRATADSGRLRTCPSPPVSLLVAALAAAGRLRGGCTAGGSGMRSAPIPVRSTACDGFARRA
ncbi:hypothetical protein GCM10010404_38980 [Nonomuraea africana]